MKRREFLGVSAALPLIPILMTPRAAIAAMPVFDASAVAQEIKSVALQVKQIAQEIQAYQVLYMQLMYVVRNFARNPVQSVLGTLGLAAGEDITSTLREVANAYSASYRTYQNFGRMLNQSKNAWDDIQSGVKQLNSKNVGKYIKDFMSYESYRNSEISRFDSNVKAFNRIQDEMRRLMDSESATLELAAKATGTSQQLQSIDAGLAKIRQVEYQQVQAAMLQLSYQDAIYRDMLRRHDLEQANNLNADVFMRDFKNNLTWR